jgi:hypothetical protein
MQQPGDLAAGNTATGTSAATQCRVYRASNETPLGNRMVPETAVPSREGARSSHDAALELLSTRSVLNASVDYDLLPESDAPVGWLVPSDYEATENDASIHDIDGGSSPPAAAPQSIAPLKAAMGASDNAFTDAATLIGEAVSPGSSFPSSGEEIEPGDVPLGAAAAAARSTLRVDSSLEGIDRVEVTIASLWSSSGLNPLKVGNVYKCNQAVLQLCSKFSTHCLVARQLPDFI